MAKLKEKYKKEVVPALMKNLGIKNKERVPSLLKIAVNMGISVNDKDALKDFTEQLGTITGQRPLVTKAKKSISNFKLREGMSVGAKVTLRGIMMYEFLDRLVSVALPRIRDFRGISPDSFDGRGNYTFGIKDQTIFPELDPNNIHQSQGMDITLVTSTQDDNEARELLK